MIHTDISKFDSQRITLVKHKIGDVRKTITDDDLAKANGSDFHRGSRFRDNDRVLGEILGHLFAKNGMDYLKANSAFVALDSEEILPYIKKALTNLSYTDYYYTYEKEY